MPTYSQPSFQDYRNQISIIELALHAGYEWQPKKGKTLPVLYHPGFDDHIVVKNPNDSANQVYFKAGSYSDRGTLINFVSNRLTACFSQFNNPNRTQAQCINDVLKDYLGIVPERKQSVKKLENFIHQSFREVGTEKEFSLEHYKLGQLPDKNYLTQERYINPALLNSPQFSGTVAVQRIYFDEGKPVSLGATETPPKEKHVVENIAFPYIPSDGEAINGLELRTATFKSHAPGSERGQGVWISNPNETPTERIVVGESAIDLLSYRQLEISTGLHPQADSRYASIGGSLSLDHLTTLAKFMNSSTQLVFGFDNDDKGARYALTALTTLSKDGLALTQASQQGYVALQIPSIRLQDQFSKLIAEHSLTMQTYMPQASGELSQDIRKNMFFWRNGATIPTLEIPINTALLNTVNNQLIQHGQFTRSVSIARPRGKDFNEDLKAEQLRQVKRPLLFINPVKNQIVNRFATEEDARQYIEKELIKKGKLEAMPIGTELRILKTNPNKLHPEQLGHIRIAPTGIEKNFTDAFKAQANRQRHEPKLTNEQSP
ncbi:toprim domain-containing protein (plasmid) [Spirosoma sp. SC4-14]|uniref:toprim domain-containing protein n=1 Tax=Spirosoma sp. SC4-14 TaxID=3128900 RepID=UPI0030D0C665